MKCFFRKKPFITALSPITLLYHFHPHKVKQKLQTAKRSQALWSQFACEYSGNNSEPSRLGKHVQTIQGKSSTKPQLFFHFEND